jgi:serine/threonine protein kinase
MESGQAESATEPRREVDRGGVQGWLDALSSGACDEGAFLRAVQKLTSLSPDAGWDTLSLLDQYYRLGKIQAPVFNSLRASLGTQLVGNGAEDAAEPQTRGALAQAQPAQRPPEAPPRAQRQPASRRQQPSLPMKHPSPSATAQTLPAHSALITPRVSARTAAPASRAVMHEIAVGDVLRDRYVIKSVLGRGSMGTVFEAADSYRLDSPDAGQRVALKVLHPHVAGRSESLTQLQREFQLMQSLSHPNIVRTHDFDRDGDIAFFTMEYLRGLSLVGVLAARNQQAPDRPHALAILRDAGSALAHAHSRAVVHADFNPGNIFITNNGEVRVLDFGAVSAPSRGPAVSKSQSDQAPVAAPRYASCQVLEGSRADARDDLYALACVAYVLLSGKHPFAEKTAAEAREQRLKPRRPSGLTSQEWRALKQGLAFDRERRPADVAKWLTAFDWRKAASELPALTALVRVPASRRYRTRPSIVAAGAVLLAAGAWMIWNLDWLERSLPQASTELNEALAGAAPSLERLWGNSRTDAPGEGARAELPSPAAGRTDAQQAAVHAPPALAAPAAVVPVANARAAVARAAAASPAPTPRAAAASPSPNGEASASRIELAADRVEVPPADPAARVVVRRKGGLHGAASFSWWTEAGTARPEHDFIAVAPRHETIEDGKTSVNLFIPVVGDANRRDPKNFYVVIGDPGSGASLGARTLTLVTIPPSGR